jgi:hypothetical protein
MTALLIGGMMIGAGITVLIALIAFLLFLRFA